ncbi:hypothetical protein [Streptomyces sp. NPDC058548]|uniref:hypothetical protein n=1 Tax=unclassified Streptomyces TaxID=2593676 RepID=UPI0036641525
MGDRAAAHRWAPSNAVARARLLQHERQAWELYRARDYTTGAAAYDIEQAVLERLRGNKLCPFLTMDVMPNGWSETCSGDRVTADEVWAMVEEETRRAPDAYGPARAAPSPPGSRGSNPATRTSVSGQERQGAHSNMAGGRWCWRGRTTKLLVDELPTEINLRCQELRVLVYPSGPDLSSSSLRLLRR